MKFIENPSRREFLAQGAGALWTAASFSWIHHQQRRERLTYYQGDLPTMKGYPLITSANFNRLTTALRNTRDPMLEKISADVTHLHTSPKPNELPDWINPDSFPIPITYQEIEHPGGYLGEAHYLGYPADGASRFRIPGYPRVGIEMGKLSVGISLTPNKDTVKQGSLAEALILAKEHLTHMFSIRSAQQFTYLMSLQGLAPVFDEHGEVITNKNRLERAGATVMYDEKIGTKTWKIVDAAPIFLVAASVLSLIKRKSLPETGFAGMAGFYLAAESINKNTDLRNEISSVVAPWIRQNTLLPPESSPRLMFGPVVTPHLLAYHDEIARLRAKL